MTLALAAVEETGDTQVYFVGSCVSGRDGPNPVLRLATQGLFTSARSTGLARFPRSRLATLFFVKILMCSYEGPGWPGY